MREKVPLYVHLYLLSTLQMLSALGKWFLSLFFLGGCSGVEVNSEVEVDGDETLAGEVGRLLDLGVASSITAGDTGIDWDLALTISLSFLFRPAGFFFYGHLLLLFPPLQRGGPWWGHFERLHIGIHIPLLFLLLVFLFVVVVVVDLSVVHCLCCFFLFLFFFFVSVDFHLLLAVLLFLLFFFLLRPSLLLRHRMALLFTLCPLLSLLLLL